MDRYKIIILGPANSGKTTILNQIKGDYNPMPDLYIPTLGVDLGCKSINIKNKEVKIQFWDTAGQERFDSIVSLFYKKANMAFIVFDISDININFSIDSLIEKIYLQSGEIPIILIGNKTDKIGDYESKSISRYKIDIDEFDKITQYYEISALNSKLGLKHLSLGMSNDYALALKYQSTFVRIGSAIFGERKFN